ncbi:MAG: cobyrinate a,c-diamide synthase [Pseudomonadota bacterium]
MSAPLAPSPGSALMIAAPSSGSGKTTVTLGLLRALRDAGIPVRAAKAGPDYIDPGFHRAACGHESVNLDPWAMRPGLLKHLVLLQSENGPLLIEAMMGLFDGAADGTGSAADLAMLLNCPIVLVIDASKQSHSVAALIEGFMRHRSGLRFAGVIFNRVGSQRHADLLREAARSVGTAVLGMVKRNEALQLPERHLGLVQAEETDGLEVFVQQTGLKLTEDVNLDALCGGFGELKLDKSACSEPNLISIPPFGQRIAIAQDQAFSFCYPHLVAGWREACAHLRFFSPLHNETVPSDCDAVYLPGGYPELHAEQLSASSATWKSLGDAAARGATIFGECGGYMVLGEALRDANGCDHAMAGLLPLHTSFAEPKLHLGYRRVAALTPLKFADCARDHFTAHEFHYAEAIRTGDAEPLFQVIDAIGSDFGRAGLRRDRIMGSFMHLIDRVETPNSFGAKH